MEDFIYAKKMDEIKKLRMRIEHYKEELLFEAFPIRRIWLESKLIEEIDYMLTLMEEICSNMSSGNRQVKEFTKEELSSFDGMNGKAAYVAINGVVYDVSKEATWGGASHFGVMAGKDVTAEFNSCHKEMAVLAKLPKVGVYLK